MIHAANIHLEYLQRGASSNSDGLTQKLSERRARLMSRVKSLQGRSPELDASQNEWLARSFPVLSVVAPVMSTSEDKIEFPGDPMCIYSALSYAVNQVVQTRALGWDSQSPYNDLCPQWGYLPSAEYRQAVDDNGIRRYDDPLLNTDQTVFDPRVWNEKVKQYFIEVVLAKVQPKVVLIGSVSPGFRYAIEIARTIRQYLPETLIVLGGRHADETIHYDSLQRELSLEPSSPLTALDPQAGSVFDFILSGQGYYTIDLLMKSIALSMDIETRSVKTRDVIETLSEVAPLFKQIPGQSLIVAQDAGEVHAWPVAGPKLELCEMPSPYQAFAIRARFPIFETGNHVSRTAHFMVTNACPFHCYYCSEGSTVVGGFSSFDAASIEKAIERVVEYLDFGAEALFFDDSMFWGGNVKHILEFCQQWINIREQAQIASAPLILFGRQIEPHKILDLEWGAQLTVDFVASRRDPQQAIDLLNAMRQAGCTYIYIGIESMAAPIISKVHKNVNQERAWDERVREALGVIREVGIRVGSSVLFGLDGETEATIEETIDKVETLLAEDLLYIASPNILTYHPNTELTHSHQMEAKLDYHSPNIHNEPPYVYFEEAFPSAVSRNLTEEKIWYIHQQTQVRWGKKRNLAPMAPLSLPVEA
jgi:radical SAM superfamily enzyme YgiQ (UPF0313 family)